MPAPSPPPTGASLIMLVVRVRLPVQLVIKMPDWPSVPLPVILFPETMGVFSSVRYIPLPSPRLKVFPLITIPGMAVVALFIYSPPVLLVIELFTYQL